METVEMETKYCDNCKKDVPVGNYLNHSIHCPRNIRLCPKCDEPYPIVEMDKHLATDHEEVVCPECYEFMEAVELPTHQADSCPKRMVSCIICEVDLPACDLSEHLDYCGSRSDRCDGCGKMVLMKYQAFHLFTKHALTKPENERQLAQSTLAFVNEFSQLHGQGESSNKTVAKAAQPAGSSNDLQSSNSSSSSSRLATNSNKSQVDVTESSGDSANAPKLGAGFSTASLAAPSSSVLAMLEPVFTAPSNSRSQQVAPSSNGATSLSEQKNPSMNGVSSTSEVASRASRNVDSAINECVKSICAGLKVSSRTNASSNALANVKINNNLLNNKNNNNSRSALSSTNSKSAFSSPTNIAPGSSSATDAYAFANGTSGASSDKAPSSSVHPNSLNASSAVLAERKVMNSGMASGLNNGSASSKSQSNPVDSSRSNTTAGFTSNARAANSISGASNRTNEAGASSLARLSSRCEVLVPQSEGPRTTPVNQAPTRTRKRDFSDDAINEYMLRLEEQGLSDGLSSSSSQADSESKPRAEVSASTTSRNALRERVALIRREREEKLAEARASRTSIVPPSRPHIAEALSITNANLPESELPGPREEAAASTYRPREDVASLWSDYLEAVPNPSADTLLARLTRAMPRECSRGSAPGRPTRASNFDALTHPRPRRDEVLTRAELRGLNDALEVDRQAQSRLVEGDATLCLPCEFCDALIPVDHLILHQTGCRPDLIYH